MTYLGAHLSSSGGFYKMGKAALAIGANTFQCFVRNPRGAKAKTINPADLGKLRELMAEHQFGPIVAHAPYIMNPCSKDEGIRALAAEMMAGDLALMEYLPGNYYNFHPGSHVGQGVEAGCRQIADMLNAVVKPEQQTMVLLETMAGGSMSCASSWTWPNARTGWGSAWTPATSPTGATTLQGIWTGCWRILTGRWACPVSRPSTSTTA